MSVLVDFFIRYEIFIDIICVIITVTSALCVIFKKERKGKVIICVLTACALFVFAISKFMVPQLVKIPRIENCSFDTAKILLSAKELPYTIVNEADYEKSDELFFVVSLAHDVAGDYIKKDTIVELKVIDLNTNDFLDESLDWDRLNAYTPGQIKMESSTSRADIHIGLNTFVVKQIIDGGRYTVALSKQINDVPTKLYLFDIERNIIYKEYTISEMTGTKEYIFSNIPYGNYFILAECEGYFRSKIEILVNGNMVFDGQQYINVNLAGINEQEEVPFRLTVMDENYNAIPKAMCSMYNLAEQNKREFETDENGDVSTDGFYAKKNTEFYVRVEVGGVYYGDTKVTIEEYDNIILVLRKDKSITVTNTADIYNY